jgi:hypothetical protein
MTNTSDHSTRDQRLHAEDEARNMMRNPEALSDEDGYKVQRAVLQAPAILTEESMCTAEDTFRADSYAEVRRVAFGILKHSGLQICDRTVSNRQLAVEQAEFVEEIGSYIEYLKAIVLLMETAEFRVKLALTMRADVEDVVREGKAVFAARKHSESLSN